MLIVPLNDGPDLLQKPANGCRMRGIFGDLQCRPFILTEKRDEIVEGQCSRNIGLRIACAHHDFIDAIDVQDEIELLSNRAEESQNLDLLWLLGSTDRKIQDNDFSFQDCRELAL